MLPNDVLRSLRYTLNIPESRFCEIAQLSGTTVSPADMGAYLKNETDEGYKPYPAEVFGGIMDGIIIFKRGKDDSRAPAPRETVYSNNMALKKIRVAFNLKESDLVTLIEKSGLKVSKAELGSFFRKPDHRNFRPCKDQFLRNLLKGLAS